MEALKIEFPDPIDIHASIQLNGSKSISNRALVIKALANDDFEIENLSNAQDTVTLNTILQNLSPEIDAGAGGTTYRFLTSFLCTQPGKYVLTGSERMKERPIKVLVEALNQLGAKIEYLEKVGYPPLSIDGTNIKGGKITMPGDISSQYLSSLLMIAPKLSGGLELEWEGTLVSRPYLLMTLNIMEYFGAKYELNENSITVFEGDYIAKDFYVEGDWSAASYYYSIAALAKNATIELQGLNKKSVQGDAMIVAMMEDLGVSTTFHPENHSVTLTKSKVSQRAFSFNFIECPDVAQTIIALLTGLKINGLFIGLQTLKIKETDRVAALRNEMAKLGANFEELDNAHWKLSFEENAKIETQPVIPTYEDHRMAMAIAPLCLVFGPLIIEEPNVVSKSYPKFWDDLKDLGFRVKGVGV
jgi:3-phosphoshikimate 1-carboxyvinyltransferase